MIFNLVMPFKSICYDYFNILKLKSNFKIFILNFWRLKEIQKILT